MNCITPAFVYSVESADVVTWYTVIVGLTLAVWLVIGVVKYVSFDSMAELWLKIVQITCPALKAHVRIVYGLAYDWQLSLCIDLVVFVSVFFCVFLFHTA